MSVLFRGVIYETVVEAAASIGCDPVKLHLELVRSGKESAQPWHGDEGDGYLPDEPEAEPGEKPKRSKYQLIKRTG